jgi:hypothetical protein
MRMHELSKSWRQLYGKFVFAIGEARPEAIIATIEGGGVVLVNVNGS